MEHRIVFIGNCDAQGNTGPTGQYAKKAQFRSYRWVNYADYSEDIVLVHLPFPEDYKRFREKEFGFCPIVLNPYKSPEPLNLANSILLDRDLLNNISQLIKKNKSYKYTLVASVNTSQVFEIGKVLDLQVAEPSEEQIKSGLKDNLNNKIKFLEIFKRLGFTTPGGTVSYGKDQIIESAKEIHKKYGKVMLRKPCEAGEQGNLPLVGITEQEMIKRIDNLENDWFTIPILVEPFLDLTDSPCTMGIINSDRSTEILHTGTQIFAKSAYCWISPPNYQKKVIDEMERKLSIYMKEIAKKGAIGWMDIDWGKTKDDRIIGIESNYRMTGWTPGAMLMRKMFGKNKKNYSVLFCSEAFPLKQSFSLNYVIGKLNELGIYYDRKKRRGVVLNCPPGDHYAGILVLAENHEEIRDIINKLNWLTDEFEGIKEI